MRIELCNGSSERIESHIATHESALQLGERYRAEKFLTREKESAVGIQ